MAPQQCSESVSYTHLDVYKRQALDCVCNYSSLFLINANSFELCWNSVITIRRAIKIVHFRWSYKFIQLQISSKYIFGFVLYFKYSNAVRSTLVYHTFVWNYNSEKNYEQYKNKTINIMKDLINFTVSHFLNTP